MKMSNTTTYFREGVEVHLYGIDKLRENLVECVDEMLDVFNDVHNDTPNVFLR